MSDFDYRSLNNSAQQSQPQEDSRDVEAYLKQELQNGVSGDPQRLKANYNRLQEEIERKKVKLEIVARQHEGAKRTELEGQAQAKIGRLNQILNELYFQQTASIDVALAPLPPEPVYQGPKQPTEASSLIQFLVMGIGSLCAYAVLTGLDYSVLGSLLALATLVISWSFYPSYVGDKFKDDTEAYNLAVEEFQNKHNEWEKLKREHELLKNNARGQDELDKYL